jgi:hypothetical protein
LLEILNREDFKNSEFELHLREGFCEDCVYGFTEGNSTEEIDNLIDIAEGPEIYDLSDATGGNGIDGVADEMADALLNSFGCRKELEKPFFLLARYLWTETSEDLGLNLQAIRGFIDHAHRNLVYLTEDYFDDVISYISGTEDGVRCLVSWLYDEHINYVSGLSLRGRMDNTRLREKYPTDNLDVFLEDISIETENEDIEKKTELLRYAYARYDGRDDYKDTLDRAIEKIETVISNLTYTDIVSKEGLALKYIEENEQTPKICMAAVEENGLALKFVSPELKTEELCNIARQNDPDSIKYFPETFADPVEFENPEDDYSPGM